MAKGDTAQTFNKTFQKIIFWSILFGCIFTTAGIFLSYYLNLPSGPMIIFASVFVYAVFLIGRKRFVLK